MIFYVIPQNQIYTELEQGRYRKVENKDMMIFHKNKKMKMRAK